MHCVSVVKMNTNIPIQIFCRFFYYSQSAFMRFIRWSCCFFCYVDCLATKSSLRKKITKNRQVVDQNKSRCLFRFPYRSITCGLRHINFYHWIKTSILTLCLQFTTKNLFISKFVNFLDDVHHVFHAIWLKHFFIHQL